MSPRLAAVCWAFLAATLGPAPAHAAAKPPICTALGAESVDIGAVRQALSHDPQAIDAVCTSPWPMGATMAGFVMSLFTFGLPAIASNGFKDSYGTLELAVLRGSAEAVAVLRRAGADPTHRTKHTRTAIERAVDADLAHGGTTWTDRVLAGWTGDLTPRDLHEVQLDRLFFAPALERHLQRHGLPPHGTDASGRTWLHRSLGQPGLPFEQRTALGLPTGEPAAAARVALTPDKVLARGVPINKQDRRGHAALYYAAWTGTWTAWDALIAAGARLDRATEEPEDLLMVMVQAGAEERYRKAVRWLARDGHVQPGDLADLASWLVRAGKSEHCGVVAKVGATPAPNVWSDWLRRDLTELLDQALDCGFQPPFAVIKQAFRQRRWPAARRLVRGANLSRGQVRRLQIMAVLRGAPTGVHRQLRKVRKRPRNKSPSRRRSAG